MKTRKLRVGRFVKLLVVDEETKSWPFREIAGGLMWLVISIRLDISNAVRSVARYYSTPKTIHWKAALGVLAYINDTFAFGITYQRETSVGFSLEVFADAGYASKATDMCRGACICGLFRTQKRLTLSMSEAEYVARGDAVKQLLFLRQVWRFMLPGKGMSYFPIF